MLHRIWRLQPKDPSKEEFIHGLAERIDSVQYPTKENFVVTKFDNMEKNDTDCDVEKSNAAKKIRIRSPLKSLQNSSPANSQIEVRNNCKEATPDVLNAKL